MFVAKKLADTKPVYQIEFLNTFVYSALAITIPLLMLDRKISLGVIGITFAFLPLAFALIRLLMSVYADKIGNKKFFEINALAQAAGVIIYIFSNSALFFLIGKISEGVRDAALWSVNRQAVYQSTKDRRKGSTTLMSIDSLADAFGKIFAGFALAFFTYTYTLYALFAISLLLIIPVRSIKNDDRNGKVDVKHAVNVLNFFRKPGRYKNLAILTGFGLLPVNILFGFAMQIFLKSNDFGFEQIGLTMALYSLLSGIIALYFMNRIRARAAIVIQTIMLCLGISLLIFLPYKLYIVLAMAVLAVSCGMLLITNEILLLKALGKSKSAVDIGLYFLPLHIARFITFAAAGFIIELYGFGALFALSAIPGLIFFAKIQKYL